MNEFEQEVASRVAKNREDEALCAKASAFMEVSIASKYSYNFGWLGRPVIQYPQDLMALQELIWRIKPDLIVETGIAHGGSLIFSASMLALLDLCDAELGIASAGPGRKVLGVDIDIRAHNRAAIEAHPMASRIQMIQGSSIDPGTVEQVRAVAAEHTRVLVCLDSNHTHEHVLAELEAYGPLTSVDSYCVVFDTLVEDMPAELAFDRPWGPGNNPKTAVWEFIKSHSEFEIDKDIHDKLLITAAPEGYLRRWR